MSNLIKLLCCVLIIGCANQNDFKYKGELPTDDFINLYDAERIGDLTVLDSSDVSIRNRIYFRIDSSMNVFLNGNPVSSEHFERDFRFVYLNPKKLKHLPESPEKAVVFVSIDIFRLMRMYMKRSEDFKPQILSIKKKQIEVSEIQMKMEKVVLETQEAYALRQFDKSLEELTAQQTKKLEQKFPINRAVNRSFMAPLEVDKGIMVKVPEWTNEPLPETNKRNVISIKVTAKSKVLLNGNKIEIKEITRTVKTMIINKNQNVNFPENPQKAIVSLKNERGTGYEIYLEVYNEIKRAYTELWDEKSMELYGKPYSDDGLNLTQRKRIKTEIPMILSESEPTAFGDEK